MLTCACDAQHGRGVKAARYVLVCIGRTSLFVPRTIEALHHQPVTLIIKDSQVAAVILLLVSYAVVPGDVEGGRSEGGKLGSLVLVVACLQFGLEAGVHCYATVPRCHRSLT